MVYRTQYPSPLGLLTLTAEENCLTGLWMPTQKIPYPECIQKDDLPVFREVCRWLDAYFLGNPWDISALPLRPAGTEFQQLVWDILKVIPYGETTTYGAIAKILSPTMSAQAVGGAVGKNPIAIIIIPCHRVVGTDGALTGYAGGIENKKWLLRHEEETK